MTYLLTLPVPKPPPVQVPKPVPKSAGTEPEVVDRLTPVEDFPGYVESRKQAEKDPFGKEYKVCHKDKPSTTVL